MLDDGALAIARRIGCCTCSSCSSEDTSQCETCSLCLHGCPMLECACKELWVMARARDEIRLAITRASLAVESVDILTRDFYRKAKR